VSLPGLTTVTGAVIQLWDEIGRGLSISSSDKSGSTIPISLPKLQGSNSTSFGGVIQRSLPYPYPALPLRVNKTSISIPSLINTQGNIYISAFKPLAINFTTLETVNYISLTGNISRYLPLSPPLFP
jgi:hypothetical protein